MPREQWTPRFRPRLEMLECRETPARLIVLNEPPIAPVGAVTSSSQQVAFPTGYGFEWSARSEVTAPPGSAAGTFHPGAFTWSGFLEVAVVPDSLESPGMPVSVFVSSSGLIRWDLDPKNSSGPSTNEVRLQAGIDGQSPWFELIGGQSDPGGSTTGFQTRSASGYVEVATMIGGTIRVAVDASGRSDSWVLDPNTFRGKALAELGIGFYMPPDLVAGPITWNRDGTVSLNYEVHFRDLDPTVELQNWLFWLSEDDAPVSEPIPVHLPSRVRGPHELRVPVGPPPVGARKLAFSLNSDWFADEQTFENNWSQSEFVHSIAFTGATYDGDAQPDVIGRFFSGVSVPGQQYLISISPDLATFVRDSRQILVRVGPQILAVEPAASGPAWDGLTFRTAPHDPGGLFSDTTLSVQVMAGGRVMAQTSALIDVEPLPTWIRASRSWASQFHPATLSYVFSGTLLNLGTSTTVNPVRQAVGLPGIHRLTVQADVQVSAPLDPTRSDLVVVNGTGRVTGVYHNRQLFDMTGPLHTAPFGMLWQLDPRSLALSLGQISLNLAGQTTLNNIFGTGTRAWGFFRTTPTMQATVDYVATMALSFASDGRLIPNLSTLSFEYRGTLQGNLGVTLPMGPNLNTALMRLRSQVGVPPAVLQQIHGDLTGTRHIPHLQIESPATGRLDAGQTVRLRGFGQSPWVMPLSRFSILRITPNMGYTLTWDGGSFVEAIAARLNRRFALDRQT